MFAYLKKTTSLDNLHCHERKGQIATMLILFMVAIIIFILATVNIGTTSLDSMKVTRIADTAALQLASILAASARSAWEQMGKNYEYVEEGGWVAGIAAFIVALACFVVGTIFHQEWLYIFGAKAWEIGLFLIAVGTLTGAITGGLVYEDTWQGIKIGAMQGAMAGGIVAMAEYFYLGLEALEAAGPVTQAGEMLSGIGGMIPGAGTMGEQLLMIGSELSLAGISAITLSVLAAGSDIYMAIDEGIDSARARANTAKVLGQLHNVYLNIREQIFMSVLGQLVTDEKKVPDTYDIDRDEVPNDMVLAFDQWYYERAMALKENTYVGTIEELFDSLDQHVLWYNGSPSKNPNSLKEFLLQTERYGVECPDTCCSGVNPSTTGINCPEGRVTELFRDLEGCASRFNFNFYTPDTPTRDDYLEWYNCRFRKRDSRCDSPNFDSLDYVHEAYKKWVDKVQELKDNSVKNIDAMESDKGWVDSLYSGDPESTDTLYEGLMYILTGKANEGFTGLRNWAKTFNDIRQYSLNRCQLAYNYYYPDQLSESYVGSDRGCRRCDPPIPPSDGDICGEPYDPRSIDESTARHIPTDDYPNRIYPCVWKKTKYSAPTLGTYFPNYPCRVSPADKVIYTNQLASIRSFVDNLENYIRNDSRNRSIFNALLLLCPPAGQATLTQPNYTISIGKISLAGDKQPRCSRADARNNAVITYEFQVSLGCCDSSGSSCVNNVSYSAWTTRQDPLYGVRDITEIIEASSKEAFLERVRNMDESAKAIQIPTSAYFPSSTVLNFASTDSDLDDEFNPVIETIKAQETTINAIRDAILKFINSVTSTPQDGRGSLTYCWPEGNNDIINGCDRSTLGSNQYAATVETGPFLMPKVTTKHMKVLAKWIYEKYTYNLINHCDNYTSCGYNTGRTWVKVSWTQPANRAVTSSKVNLGIWNPFRGSSHRTITKKVSAKFNVGMVDIAKRE